MRPALGRRSAIACTSGISVLLAISILLACEGSSRANIGYVGCNGRQQQTLVDALTGAKALTGRAFSYMQKVDLGHFAPYKKWYGEFSDSNRSIVATRLAMIADALDSENLSFDCTSSSPECMSGRYSAQVSPGDQTRTIYLCDGFWSAPAATGLYRQDGILVHELGHFDTVAHLSDLCYGVDACTQLALTSPDQAIGSAENYEDFVDEDPLSVYDAAGCAPCSLAGHRRADAPLALAFALVPLTWLMLRRRQRRSSSVFFLFVLTLSSIALGAGCATSHPPVRAPVIPSSMARIACHIQVSSSGVVGAPIDVRLTLHNKSGESLDFDRGHTPFEHGSVSAPYFKVIHDGQPLAYKGPILDFAPSHVDDLKLNPDDQETSRPVDISVLYPIVEPGLYWVLYERPLFIRTARGVTVGELACDPASLRLTAPEAPAEIIKH